jgi:hypothetical protein
MSSVMVADESDDTQCSWKRGGSGPREGSWVVSDPRQVLQRQEKVEEARDLLAPVYAWFAEGLGTPDLRNAKTLLDALSPIG